MTRSLRDGITVVWIDSTDGLKNKINLWLIAPKGATPVNQTSATDWQMALLMDYEIKL